MPDVIECLRCGTRSPEGFRFCPACGGSLADAVAAPAPTTAAPVEQRRIVTALFCDLVGFTASSEHADPEDVDRMLTAYGAMARTEIERHGGTIEKFIGDAVVGVFGVPIAHEDDALRAVRAGLDIAARAADLKGPGNAPLRLRVGINTGEVLARLGVEARSGERFLAGDAINTASRIQSAAPEMGVAVGFETYEATRSAIAYVELKPVSLKGKAEPVRIFHATSTRARTGVDATPAASGTYIGRADELHQLRALFDQTGTATPATLVTVVGEAGMGKSRLLAELRAQLQREDRSITWRQGRCLPYGEGITFWALGEIVKAQAGILESDPAAVVQVKLEAAISPGQDAAWLHERLLPLVGVESAQASREESFAAWRRFLEGLAADRAAIVVIEDLHWADDALLAFLEDVARQAVRGPLFVLTTARPDFLGSHPAFATELPNAYRLELAPLSSDDTTVLVDSLLGSVLPPDLAGPIVERADGNPLYAEEYVALLRDRDLLVETDGTARLRPGVELPVPTSIHSLLASRLDTLPTNQKALLTDAAVVGKVFWDGALVAMDGQDRPAVDAALGQLAGLGFVRRNPQSSMAGEQEYSFWHVLGRDVAYRQLPRGSRADRHAAAATWLEDKLGERVDDIADVLADHWRTALELSQAAGHEERATEYQPKALGFLIRAGDRARGLDTAAATARYEAALALTPPGHPDRPDVLLRFGSVACYQLRFDESLAALDEAIEAWSAEDDWHRRGQALLARLLALWETYDFEKYGQVSVRIDEALALLESHEPTPELVDVLTEKGIDLLWASRPLDGLAVLNRALDVARSLGLPTPGRTLGFRGETRLSSGDPGGMDDLRASVDIAKESGRGRDLVIATVNTGNWQTMYEGAEPGARTVQEAIALATRFGYAGLAVSMKFMSIGMLIDAGEIDEAVQVQEEVAQADSRLQEPSMSPHRIQALRGDAAEALSGAERYAALVLPSADSHPDKHVMVFARLAEVRVACGQYQAALGDVERVLAVERRASTESYVGAALPYLTRAACAAGRVDLAEKMLSEVQRTPFPLADHAQAAARALIAEHRGRLEEAVAGHRDAAERWASFTMRIEEAHAHLGHARCLIALGRHDEAAAPIAAARAICERMGAKPMLADLAALDTGRPAQAGAG